MPRQNPETPLKYRHNHLKGVLSMNCNECQKRKTCTKLCDEVEEFVNQDHVPQTEKLLSTDYIDRMEEIADWPGCDISDPLKLKLIIIQLYQDGLSNAEIAYHLPCDKSYISRVLTKFKDK